MTLHVWGTDYRRSSSELRQKLYLEPSGRGQELKKILSLGFGDIVYLHTCNRVEFYTSAPNYYVDTRVLWHRLFSFLGLPEDTYFSGYHYEGKTAIRHLLRVASSLESFVVGEPQILGQLKQAVSFSVEQGIAIESGLENSFSLAFETAKRVRSETSIGEKTISVAALGVQRLESLEEKHPLERVVVVGRSPMSLNFLSWLKKNRPHVPVMWVNRRVELLGNYKEADGVECVALSEFLKSPRSFSHLFTATSSPAPVFTESFFEKLDWKNHLVFDFAEPADVEAPLCGHKVTCIRLSDLREEAEANARVRQSASQAAEIIVEESIRDFFLRQKQAPVLKNFSAIESACIEELDRAVEVIRSELPLELEPKVRAWAEKLVRKQLYQSQKHLRDILRGDGSGGAFPL